MGSQVTVTDDTVIIQKVECSDASVVEYFGEIVEVQRPEAVTRALSLGVTGLRSMGARADVDQVERGFEQLRREFRKAFDPERKNSYLGQLAETVDDLLGEDGAVAAAMAENGETVVKTILEQIAQLRDAVVGTIATAAEREKGTAKGCDFEADVETILCRLARVYGDTVENVSTTSGEAGDSRKGRLCHHARRGPPIHGGVQEQIHRDHASRHGGHPRRARRVDAQPSRRLRDRRKQGGRSATEGGRRL